MWWLELRQSTFWARIYNGACFSSDWQETNTERGAWLGWGQQRVSGKGLISPQV